LRENERDNQHGNEQCSDTNNIGHITNKTYKHNTEN
jgi:hypothetical protein